MPGQNNFAVSTCSFGFSIIFYVDGLDHACDPFKKANMGNDNEQMYYAYAAARYSASENIMWDIANEYHLFRTPEWADKMGPTF